MLCALIKCQLAVFDYKQSHENYTYVFFSAVELSLMGSNLGVLLQLREFGAVVSSVAQGNKGLRTAVLAALKSTLNMPLKSNADRATSVDLSTEKEYLLRISRGVSNLECVPNPEVDEGLYGIFDLWTNGEEIDDNNASCVGKPFLVT